MKNLKKLFVMSILAISMFVLCGMTSVKAAAFTLQNIDLICDPAKLDKGSRATCYIIGVPSSGDSVHGYVVHAYTTKYLKLIGAQAVIPNSDQVWTSSSSASAGSITAKDKMPTEIESLKCLYDSEGMGNVTPTTFGCGVFYTMTNLSDAFTPSSIKSDAVKSKVNAEIMKNATYGVIGALIVELDENTVGNECGEVCYKTWRVPVVAEYANYSTCGGTGVAGCGAEKNTYDCKEIHYNEDGTFTETGAFASYALLAACALIAISAITLAKKNNKFSRI